MTKTRFSAILVLLCLFLVFAVQMAAAGTLLMISVDGLRPDYVTQADKHGLKIPNLRRMMAQGAYAEGVVGVVPTVTYPSHTTLITGVWPNKHGIYANTFFDPDLKNQAGWYWYSEDIKVPTLWDVTRAAGLATASIDWPVSVSAPVNYLLPEVWRAGTPEDRKLMHALATPGLLTGLEKELGPYAEGLGSDLANDRIRTKFAIAILQRYKPNFMTLHLVGLDHQEHETGPFSPEANAVLEGLDELLGQLTEALRAVDPQSVLCVVSDHGFFPTDHRLNLTSAFVEAGLIEMGKPAASGALTVKSWQASPWISGGLATIMLKDPNDAAVRGKVEKLLQQLAADPANGINRIVSHEELVKLGGDPDAAFLVDLKSGFQYDSTLTGPVHREYKPGGTHGYLPEHPELRASFFVIGLGIPAGKNLGVIDMRQIAPTVAQLLGLSMPSADGKALAVSNRGASSSRLPPASVR